MTQSDAIDEVFGICTTAWNIATENIIGLPNPAELRYQGLPVKSPPPSDLFWGYASYQGVLDGIAGMGSSAGTRIFEASGLFYLQIFCPKRRGAMQQGRLVAEAVQAAFRQQSPSGNAWFRNAAIRNAVETDSNYQINFVVTVTYSDFILPADTSYADTVAFLQLEYGDGYAQFLQTLNNEVNTGL